MEKKFNNVQNKCIKHEGKDYWISRSCAVVGIITTYVTNVRKTNSEFGNKVVLVVKRGSGSTDYPGKYCLPCGYMDWNESAYEAFKREIFEETNIDLDLYKNGFNTPIINGQEQPCYVNSNPSNNRQNVTMYFKHIIVQPVNEVSNLNCEEDEIDEIIWIKPSDVDKYEFCFGHDEIIKLLA